MTPRSRTACPASRPESLLTDAHPVTLADVGPGQRVTIGRVCSGGPDAGSRAEELLQAGLVPGLTVTVIERSTDRSMRIRTGRGEVRVTAGAAAVLAVTSGDLSTISDQLR